MMRKAALALLAFVWAWPASANGYLALSLNDAPARGEDSAADLSGMGARPGGPGALARPFRDWFSDRANVAAFPGADLSARFAAACASLPASGGTIYIPGGQYTSNGRLTCNSKSLRIMGDGHGVTTVVFTNSDAGAAGLYIDNLTYLQKVSVENLSLFTQVDQKNGNSGLYIGYKNDSIAGPYISNIEVAGTGINDHYWHNGIVLQNVFTFKIDKVHIRGKEIANANSYPDLNMIDGISVGSNTSNRGCSDGTINTAVVFFAKYAGHLTAVCEGTHFHQFTAVAVENGIVLDNGNGYPGLFISDSHINAFSVGVAIAGVTQVNVHDNLFYKWSNSTQNWSGILLQASKLGGKTYFTNGALIRQNQFIGGGAKTTADDVGINAPGADGGTFYGNQFTSLKWGFDFNNAPTTNIAADNTFSGVRDGGGWQKNPGGNTISRNNLPVAVGADKPFIVMSRGDGPMNVGSWFQRVFYTNNPAAAATVTDLTNAEAGRQITIIAQDTNTTIAHNARIHLRGGTSMRMIPGASLTLLNVGPYWQEIGRSQ